MKSRKDRIDDENCHLVRQMVIDRYFPDDATRARNDIFDPYQYGMQMARESIEQLPRLREKANAEN